jgi:hypothetical protein
MTDIAYAYLRYHDADQFQRQIRSKPMNPA